MTGKSTQLIAPYTSPPPTTFDIVLYTGLNANCQQAHYNKATSLKEPHDAYDKQNKQVKLYDETKGYVYPGAQA